MSHRFRKNGLIACTIAVGVGAAVSMSVSACSSDPPVAADPVDAGTNLPDTSLLEPDTNSVLIPKPSPKIWAPSVLTLNMTAQPSPKIGGDPKITIPLV